MSSPFNHSLVDNNKRLHLLALLLLLFNTSILDFLSISTQSASDKQD